MLTALLTAAALTLPVTVQEGTCPGQDARFNDGCYLANTSEVWVQGGKDNAWTYWHEMGHAFDAHRLDAGERRRFSCMPAVQAPPDWQWERCGTWDEDMGEVFADAYMNCAMGAANPRGGDFVSGHLYEPTTRRRHLNVCRFINRAAG